MSLLNDIYRSAFLPLYSNRYTGLADHWRELERGESVSLEQNLERQWGKTQQVVKHAYETTRFYRERFDTAGMRPEDIRTPEDLKRLPVLTREDIRTRRNDMISSAVATEKLESSQTGGTTETPVALVRSPDTLAFRTAVQLRFYSWGGLRPGDKTFWLWGARQDFSHSPSLRWRLFERYALRRAWAYTAQITDEILEQHRQALNSFRPKAIIAYPTPLALFCEYLERTRRLFHRPAAAFVTAEPLLPQQRETILRVMGVDPYLQYGTRDFGMPASQCEAHEGLHVNPECVFLEFSPLQGSSEVHEMLVTDLTNLAMPMIRYKINDCASPILGPCSCGRGYPRITTIAGRTTDNFFLADGTVIPGVTLPGRILKTCDGIAKMQVTQEDYSRFTIKYVPGDTFSRNDLETVKANFKKYVGDGLSIQFEPVPDIPREPSGKTRFFISRVDRARSAHSGGRD